MALQAAVEGVSSPADDLPLDRVTIDGALDWLFAHEPMPHIAAVAENGLTAPMPAGVPLPPSQHITTAGSALELCVPADLTNVIEAWERVRRTGASQATVHLRSAPEAAISLYFIDARHRYDVFLAFLIGPTIDLTAIVDEQPLFRPRLCTIERDEFGTIRHCDEAATEILGWTASELIGMRASQFVHDDDRPLAIANWMEMIAQPDQQQRGLFRYRRPDDTYVWLEGTHHNRLADPAVGRVITNMVDVSDRMDAIEALRASEQLLRRLTEALPLGIVQIDAERRIVYANERLSAIVGVPVAATFDEQVRLVPSVDRDRLDVALANLFTLGLPADVELALEHPQGPRRCSVGIRALTNDRGVATGAIVCIADITDSIRLREELETRATFDNLTGCHNRLAILERLARMLETEQPHGGIAVLFVDLDRFKVINDRFGHAAGDEVLRRVGERLVHGARNRDVVGRLGGDEFLIVCPDVASAQAALEIAQRITQSLAQRIVVGAQEVLPVASVGVAWTDAAIDANTLVARADAAMYESKRRAAVPVLFEAATIATTGLLAAGD